MEPRERQQGSLTYPIKDLLDNALSSQLEPAVEPLDRTVSVLLCHWNSDATAYPEIDLGIRRLQEVFEQDYGFPTKSHSLQQEMSSSKNQLTLLSKIQPLLYNVEKARAAEICKCNKYQKDASEVELFIFFYIGFAETAGDGSCLLRPAALPGQYAVRNSFQSDRGRPKKVIFVRPVRTYISVASGSASQH